jgi:hypothetical protein
LDSSKKSSEYRVEKINPQDPQEKKESNVKSWLVVLSIAFFFLLWGLFIFHAVGVGEPPSWRYGVMPDIPGQSVHSVRGVEERAGTTLPGERPMRKQHIMGGRQETGKPQGRKGL